MKSSTNITAGPITKGIFKLAVPAMVSMVSIMLFEFIDLYWIGKLGANAVAALGAASFVIWAIRSLANCVASGLNALIARNTGAKDYQRVQMWASQGVMLTFLFSVIIALITYFANLFLFELLGLEPEVAAMAQKYTLIMTLGLLIIYELISIENIFRAAGNTFIPMLVIVSTLVLNAILDPFFIFGWYGFPEMGVPGGALASVISHIIGLIIFVFMLPAVKVQLKYSAASFFNNSKEIFRIGTPIGLIGAVFSIIYIILSKNIAFFGTTPMAALAICHRIEGVPFFIALGFSTAVATLVGQNLGANKPTRAEKSAYLSLAYVAGFLFIVSICFIFFGKWMLKIFINDMAVINEGYRYLFAVAMFEIFLASEVVLEGAFTGAGDTKPPFFISLPLTFLRVPLAYLFSITFSYGVVAIWWVIGITTFFKGVIFFLWFQRGRWKLKKIG